MTMLKPHARDLRERVLRAVEAAPLAMKRRRRLSSA
jgi:hypothetical protein